MKLCFSKFCVAILFILCPFSFAQNQNNPEQKPAEPQLKSKNLPVKMLCDFLENFSATLASITNNKSATSRLPELKKLKTAFFAAANKAEDKPEELNATNSERLNALITEMSTQMNRLRESNFFECEELKNFLESGDKTLAPEK